MIEIQNSWITLAQPRLPQREALMKSGVKWCFIQGYLELFDSSTANINHLVFQSAQVSSTTPTRSTYCIQSSSQCLG